MLLERMFVVNQDDLTYQFLKALEKKLSVLKRQKSTDPKLF